MRHDKLSMRLSVIASVLLAGVSLADAQDIPNPRFRDTAVIPSFHNRNSDVVYFQTFLRKPLVGGHTLLLVRGGFPQPGWRREHLPAKHLFVDPRDLLGLFLMRTGNPDLVWELAVLEGREGAGRVEIERVDSSSLVLGRDDGDYGIRQESLKIFFDVSSKRVLKTVRFWPAAMEQIVATPDDLHFIAAMKDETVALEWAGERPVLLSGEAEANLFGRRSGSSSQTPVPIGDDGRLSAVLERSWNGRQVRRLRERRGDVSHLHTLPQSSRDELAAARPRSGEQKVREDIGPHQVVDGRFWFGKTFYDGEGLTGVGGIGYFDGETNRFVIFSPPEIVPWSTSALLVEDGIIWAGLVRRPEGGLYSGGLLRFEPESEEVRKYDIPEVILAIERWQDGLFLGTANGLFILRDDQQQRFVIEPALRGGWQVVEDEP